MSDTHQVNGPSRADLWRNAQGFIAETGPYLVAAGAATAGTFASGTLYGSQVYLQKGDVITNLSLKTLITVVTGQTNGFLGLYDQNGNLVAATADTGAVWTTQGMHTHPLLAAYTVSTAGVYYAAMLMVFTTLVPEIATIITPASLRVTQGDPLAGFPIYMWNQAGLAVLPNPATQPYSHTANPGVPWIGLS